MELAELRALITKKKIYLEFALENGIPRTELLQVYKELKQLQFQLILAEIKQRYKSDVTMA